MGSLKVRVLEVGGSVHLAVGRVVVAIGTSAIRSTVSQKGEAVTVSNIGIYLIWQLKNPKVSCSRGT